MAKNLTVNQKRCEDCACLIIKNGKWCCDECFGQDIEEIDDCPEGATLEEIEKINNEKIKVDTGARAEVGAKDKKPRTVVTSDEKQALFGEIYLNLYEKFGNNVQIVKENKLLMVTQGEKTFKIDVIEQRKPKK